MSRAARLFAEAPVDPRARRVVAAEHVAGGTVRLTLSCGHAARRKFMCRPSRIICRECAR